MKGVLPDIPEHILEWRARTGADQWDEMWDAVLHMPPAPNGEHRELEGALEYWLRDRWCPAGGNKVFHQINLARPGGWPDDYRIPDLVLLAPGRFGIDRNEYFEGAPTVVVEIHSPGDETIEKMPFYARLGVPELWIIDRDTKAPQIHVLADGRYEKHVADAEGWRISSATGVRLRGEMGAKLGIQLADDLATFQVLP